jgi:hypothetical protein
MTDADRYARMLGKGFRSIRGTLCSPSTQDCAAERLANYVANQLKKDLPDVRALFERAKSALDLRDGLFGAEQALEQIRRSTTGTLGAEHFADCMQLVIDDRDRPSRILEHLADRAIESVVNCVDQQRDREGRTDAECQSAIRRHAADARRELLKILESKCGLKPVIASIKTAKDDQESLLDFVIVPKE